MCSASECHSSLLPAGSPVLRPALHPQPPQQWVAATHPVQHGRVSQEAPRQHAKIICTTILTLSVLTPKYSKQATDKKWPTGMLLLRASGTLLKPKPMTTETTVIIASAAVDPTKLISRPTCPQHVIGNLNKVH